MLTAYNYWWILLLEYTTYACGNVSRYLLEGFTYNPYPRSWPMTHNQYHTTTLFSAKGDIWVQGSGFKGCGLTENTYPARAGFRWSLVLNTYLMNRSKISAFRANKHPSRLHRTTEKSTGLVTCPGYSDTSKFFFFRYNELLVRIIWPYSIELFSWHKKW